MKSNGTGRLQLKWVLPYLNLPKSALLQKIPHNDHPPIDNWKSSKKNANNNKKKEEIGLKDLTWCFSLYCVSSLHFATKKTFFFLFFLCSPKEEKKFVWIKYHNKRKERFSFSLVKTIFVFLEIEWRKVCWAIMEYNSAENKKFTLQQKTNFANLLNTKQERKKADPLMNSL